MPNMFILRFAFRYDSIMVECFDSDIIVVF